MSEHITHHTSSPMVEVVLKSIVQSTPRLRLATALDVCWHEAVYISAQSEQDYGYRLMSCSV